MKNVMKRHEGVVFSPGNVPYDSVLTFNAAVIKRGKEDYAMVFRNDFFEPGTKDLTRTNLGLAFSKNGLQWKVEKEPLFELRTDKIHRAYDPRITVIDGTMYLCFAIDSVYGVQGGIARLSDDFQVDEILTISTPDNRNMALFPEKINGKYVRLERPMPVYGRYGAFDEKFDIWMSESPDMVHWGNAKVVLEADDVEFSNCKIGPGAPPIKTKDGWLVVFHAVDNDPSRGKNGWEEKWTKRYTIGVMLLDLEDPSKIIGVAKEPLMIPETEDELTGGFRNNALFPCATILEEDDTVRIYYSAGDMYVKTATAKLDDIVALCKGELA
ncbi:MAG: glycosidase [Ruminococcaceae bacterium]|nr:glycosidase [Oscillospiraceae bacterium]